MKKQVCKDCYYAGFDKCDHVKKDETEYLSQGKNGKKLKKSISQLKTKVMENCTCIVYDRDEIEIRKKKCSDCGKIIILSSC